MQLHQTERVFAYARASDDASIISPEQQHEACHNWFQTQKLVGAIDQSAMWMGTFCDDAAEGMTDFFHRTMAIKIMAQIKPYDLIVTSNFARVIPIFVLRQLATVINGLENANVGICFLDSPFLSTTLASAPVVRLLAEIKRHELFTSAKVAYQMDVAKGTKPPYGWTLNSKGLVPNSMHRRVGELTLEMYKPGELKGLIRVLKKEFPHLSFDRWNLKKIFEAAEKGYPVGSKYKNREVKFFS